MHQLNQIVKLIIKFAIQNTQANIQNVTITKTKIQSNPMDIKLIVIPEIKVIEITNQFLNQFN